jgi:3-oxoacyl-[acyl-carrier protein] reductase
MGKILQGQTVIVTGSSAGIGRAIARQFASEGANLVVNSRSYERAGQTAKEIRDEGNDAIAVEADVTDYRAVEELVDSAVEEFGRLDVMVNNAGMTTIDKVTELSPEEWRQVIDVDLTGVFFGSQVAGRRMIDQNSGGSILNISSIMGEQGYHMRAPYCAAKAGVNNLTQTLAVEWAEHDILVNALAPGFVKTNITDQTQEAAGYTDENIRNRTPLDRFGTPEEIANCALFLAAGNHYVTGEILHTDGGWTAFAWGSWGD